MKVNIPKGPIWVTITIVVLETLDTVARFMKEHRLRKQNEKEDEVRESKNWIIKRCLQILQEQQRKGGEKR